MPIALAAKRGQNCLALTRLQGQQVAHFRAHFGGLPSLLSTISLRSGSLTTRRRGSSSRSLRSSSVASR
jgi:hypothetical protein